MKVRVFINYRRDDSGPDCISIADAVDAIFGKGSAFLDTSSLGAGAIWPEQLKKALEDAEYVLAVIGPDWLRAGADEWGRRRIDKTDDWVRQELQLALETLGKTVIPVLVRGGRIPPVDVLPDPLRALGERQSIELRRDYWHHDIKLLLAQLGPHTAKTAREDDELGPYPSNPPEGPESLGDDTLNRILQSDLPHWKKVVSPLPEDATKIRVEIARDFRFKSFLDAVHFMNQVAPGCEVAMHHPRWENLWKTLRVFLTTWDIGHKVSDRDIQLARYFERAFSEFPGARKTSSIAADGVHRR